MPEAADLIVMGNAAIVAPAGHGKTEIIANVAALGRRALILTHTHAGVHFAYFFHCQHIADSVHTAAAIFRFYHHAHKTEVS